MPAFERERMEYVHSQSSPEQKVALFRSLFRGREDVYARRFESRRSGKSGYAPACANEWVRDVCEKPRVKCAECPNRRFLAVTDEVIRWHLTGCDRQGTGFVMGVYPMLLDETCHFLAVDFDGAGWMEDADAYWRTCQDLNVPAALERSRSGRGGHVWLFFKEPIPAFLARQLGSMILTRTMEGRPDSGFRSYDRFFPNQDTLPKGGFGNLIALPLQRGPREAGNSVFLDERHQVIADQWKFLSSLSKSSKTRVESLVEGARRRGRILGVKMAIDDEGDGRPWEKPPSRSRKGEIKGPLPEQLGVVLADQIYVSKQGLTPPLHNGLIRLAAFQNPEFYRAQAMRLSTFGKRRIIGCAEDHERHVSLPRGCLEEMKALFRELGIRVNLEDARNHGAPLEVGFQGKLRTDQRAAAEALLAADTGVLSATTAFGKTVVAAWLIAKRGVNTLVLVHRRQLMDQWVDRLSMFLDVPREEIGRYGGGKKKRTGRLDVALIQSLVRRGTVDDCVAAYGHLIVDECHHISARSFELAVSRVKAKYVTGLSATLKRKDGHHPIIFMQCGPVRYHVDAKQQAARRPFAHMVTVRPTGFRPVDPPDEDPRIEFQSLCGQLLRDKQRNELIRRDVLTAMEDGRSPLLLTERKEHLEMLAELLDDGGLEVVTIYGGMGKRKLQTAFGRIGEHRRAPRLVILSTGRFIGEGFDHPCLDTLFLALPVSWKGTLAQYVGRLHRIHEGKREVRVYDYADLYVPMLSRMFDRRCRAYEEAGYTVCLPASALPGWPAEVPLPVDPLWKRNYAVSVRRLVSDGVDAGLAQLFVQTTKPFSDDAKGIERARSACEAFLFARLQSLPATRDRFQLNHRLPIVFGGMSEMEVDLVDLENKLVIELDGPQHFESAEAYRSDRRKDALLQMHGYYVSRFLTEDTRTRLDEVLDAILQALAHCQRRSS